MKCPTRGKRLLRVPHEYIIILLILIFACFMTYILPAGTYDRITDDAGKSVLVLDSYHTVEASPVGIWLIPNYIVEGLISQAGSIFSVILMTAAIEVITATGFFQACSYALARKVGGKESVIVAVLLLLFSVMGITQQSAAFIGFTPMIILLMRSLGCDALVGVSVVFLGASIGFSSSIVSPLLALAQEYAGLPLYSGMSLRIAAFVLLYLSAAVYLIHYAKKCIRNPAYSKLYGEQEIKPTDTVQYAFTPRYYVIAVILVGGMVIFVYNCVKNGWSLRENAIALFWMALAIAVVYGMHPSEAAKHFALGIKKIAPSSVIIGFAAAAVSIMESGGILDTVVKWMSDILAVTPQFLQGPLLLLLNMVVSIFITSGGGQASAIIPVLSPVVDIVGVSRQLMVLSFRLGDGICGCIQPHSGSLIAYLAAAGIPFPKWVEFYAKLLGIWVVLASMLLSFGQIIDY